MGKLEFILYNLFKTYNQASDASSVNKAVNGQFTFYDLKKELFECAKNMKMIDMKMQKISDIINGIEG